MKRNKLSTCVFYTLIILMILFVISTYLSSGLVAKYSSTDSATDSARVAKWEINFIDDDEKALQSIVESTHLESGSNGSWGLDIINNSEVSAKIADSSNIKLRLQSPNFDANHHHNTWNFLHDNNENFITNPINFTVVMYNCSLDDIDRLDNVKSVEIFDTAKSNLTFNMVIEEGTLYYETVVNVGSLLDKDFILAYATGNISLVVNWKVDEIAGAVNTTTSYTSYHVIPVSEYDKTKYQGLVSKNGVDLIENADAASDITFVYGEEQYVIAYQNHDYFEYLIYSSSVGGEVMITLVDEGKVYLKRSTKLSDDEKVLLKNRTIGNDLESLKLYIEKLGYQEYLKFEQTKSDYDKVSGYISLGLTCRIILDLKVEQVD